MSTNILIIAGEVSGDMHAAEVLRELKKIRPGLHAYGIGGDAMIREGFQPLYHINRMAFLGFTEVIRHLPFIRKVQKDLLQMVVEKGITTAILIDYPGFNLNFAKKLQKAGVQIIYYISPQIWAWGGKRIHKIRRMVARMLVLLPFEEKMYREAGVNAEFVGHPLIEQLHRYPFLSREELFTQYGLDTARDVLLVLPGSRKQEIEKIFPAVLEGAKETAAKFNLQLVIGCAPSISENWFSSYSLPEGTKLVKEHVLDFMKHARAGIIKSGTSTLQAGLLQLPMIIVYKTSELTYQIGKRLVKIQHIGLANIVAGKTIAPELIQGDVNPGRIELEMTQILSDEARYAAIKSEMGVLRALLGEKEASVNCARIISEMLNGH